MSTIDSTMVASSGSKLTVKDYISIAIFSVLFMAVITVCAILLGIVPILYPFYVTVACIPAGIIYMYLRARVPKRGAILLQTVLVSLLFFLMGLAWPVWIGSLVGGLIAELISGIRNYRSFKLNTIGYVVYSVLFHIGNFMLIFFAAEAYRVDSLEAGMSTEYTDALIATVSGPLFVVALGLTVLTSILGAYLGKVLLKKHFAKAGMV